VGLSVSRADQARGRTQISPVMRGRSQPGALSPWAYRTAVQRAGPIRGWPRCVTVSDLRAHPRGKCRPGPTDVGDGNCGVSAGVSDRLPGCEVERFGMDPAIVLGQDFTEGAGPVRDGAVADLAAGDR
jgi:hypothetical protein